MKITRLIAVLIFCCTAFYNLSGQTIAFTYDASGNMSQRSLQVMVGARMANPTRKDSLETPALSLKVYPNPANTDLNIEGKLPPHIATADVTLLDIGGQILKKTLYTGEIKTLNVEDLKNGMYILEISYSRKQKSDYKIIVAH